MEVPMLPIDKKHLSPNEIRMRLSHEVKVLFIEAILERRKLNDSEIDWAIKALEWINWHPGKTSGAPLLEGESLVVNGPAVHYH